MHRPRYTDPLGSALPALEQNIMKLRGMEMLLVLFYAEELKRDVLDLIQATDGLRARLTPGHTVRVPRGAKNPVDKALNALIADGAISLKEKEEIVALIDYRNAIAHQLQNMLGDLSPTRYARDLVAFDTSIPKYDRGVVKRLQHYQERFDEMVLTHHYVTTLNMNTLVFRATEKTFLEEINRLEHKIDRQVKERNAKMKKVNAELNLDGTDLTGDFAPGHPRNRHEDHRLTKRGIETCYRLFDLGKSEMAVAHLMRLSLVAVKNRKKAWLNLGGKARPKVGIAALPGRRRARRRRYA
jgi:hypothetical protein